MAETSIGPTVRMTITCQPVLNRLLEVLRLIVNDLVMAKPPDGHQWHLSGVLRKTNLGQFSEAVVTLVRQTGEGITIYPCLVDGELDPIGPSFTVTPKATSEWVEAHLEAWFSNLTSDKLKKEILDFARRKLPLQPPERP